MVRKHIVFYGSVQGVGFRWRAKNAAEHFSCTGWVRNEWDESVSMEIQGTEEAIEFIKTVDSPGCRLNVDVGTMIYNNESVSVLEGRVDLISHVHISEPGLKPIEERQLHRDPVSVPFASRFLQ